MRHIEISSARRFENARALMTHRILFRTDSGDLGFGLLSSRPGDQVWVLENARMLFILRPTPDVSSFERVGEFYVHGIMDGQLIENNQLSFTPISLV